MGVHYCKNIPVTVTKVRESTRRMNHFSKPHRLTLTPNGAFQSRL